MVIKLKRGLLKRLTRTRGITAILTDCAAGTGISLSVVKSIYHNPSYGARSDGRANLVKVNEWLHAAQEGVSK